jgi:Cell division control protein 14, SIN component
LRHLEALVAQIILPLHRDDGQPLGDDERLLEFLQLQDSFEWNGKRRPLFLWGDTEFGGPVCQRLLTCLDRLIAKGTNEQTTLLLLSTLDLMQGLLLIHPPSRRLFSREIHMTVYSKCRWWRLIKDPA